MAIMKALCPACRCEMEVDSMQEASICQSCGAPFITEKGIAAHAAQSGDATDSCDDPDLFPFFYKIRIERHHHAMMGRALVYLFSIDGEVCTLYDGGSVTINTNRRYFQFPVLKTNNNDIYVEGFLSGAADGNDIQIVFDPTLGKKSLGKIAYSSNPTVTFQ